jgi:vancomycin resistance protein YoaR
MFTNQKQPSPLLKRILIAFGFGLGLLVVFLLAANLLFSIYYSKRILPGVTMNGISLGGLSVNEAANEISTSVTFPEKGTILLMTGDKTWAVAPVQLGVYLDPQASAKAAYAIGRKGSILNILAKRLSSFASISDVFPVFIYDQKASVAFLTQIASQINQPIREANLSLEGTNVIINQGQPGFQLDFASSLVGISNQLQTMNNGTVQLAVLQTAPAILDASVQGDLAKSLLSQPFTFTIANSTDTVQIQPDILAQMLAFDTVAGTNGSQYQISVNQTLMRAYLTSIQDNLNTSPQNPRFIFNDDTKQLELRPGFSAVIGRTLNIENSVAALDNAIHNGAHSVELAFDTTNPAVLDTTTGAELGITELIEARTSYFRGSTPDRIQNIKTASERFHGLLIAPGEIVSMSDVLGDISLDNGYAEAMIILGDQTIKGVGGGVCQVSTTLFRTVFYSGLQILERHSHAYRVGYYEQTVGGHNSDLAGMDATVFVPIVDFKFTNDTPYWLLMETYVSTSNYSLTWKFYSTEDGRSVDYSSTGLTDIVKSPDPVYRENPDLPQGTKKQVDWAVDGATVTIYRTVTKNGQVLYSDKFFTKYQAWGDVYEYGPGTEGMPPPPPQP